MHRELWRKSSQLGTVNAMNSCRIQPQNFVVSSGLKRRRGAFVSGMAGKSPGWRRLIHSESLNLGEKPP